MTSFPPVVVTKDGQSAVAYTPDALTQFLWEGWAADGSNPVTQDIFDGDMASRLSNQSSQSSQILAGRFVKTPTGGTDGQVLVKQGAAVAWAAAPTGGGGGGSGGTVVTDNGDGTASLVTSTTSSSVVVDNGDGTASIA